MPTMREFLHAATSDMSQYAELYFMARQNKLQRDEQERLERESRARLNSIKNDDARAAAEERRAEKLFPAQEEQIEASTESSKSQTYYWDTATDEQQRKFENEVAADVLKEDVAYYMRKLQSVPPEQQGEIKNWLINAGHKLSMMDNEYGFLTEMGEEKALELQTVLAIANFGLALTDPKSRDEVSALFNSNVPLERAVQIMLSDPTMGLTRAGEIGNIVVNQQEIISNEYIARMRTREKEQNIVLPSRVRTFEEKDKDGSVSGIGRTSFSDEDFSAMEGSYMNDKDMNALDVAQEMNMFPGDPRFDVIVLEHMSPQYKGFYQKKYGPYGRGTSGPINSPNEPSPSSPIDKYYQRSGQGQ